MPSLIHSLIQNAIKSDEPKNVLITTYNTVFEWSLSKYTKHHYYIITDKPEDYKGFDNLNFLPSNMQFWPINLEFDLIICNDIINQVDFCTNISRMLHIPIIIIHHCLKQPFVKKEDIQILAHNYQHTLRIAVHPLINISWYADFPIIPYGLDISGSVATFDKNRVCLLERKDVESIQIINTLQNKSTVPITIIPAEASYEAYRKYFNEHNTLITFGGEHLDYLELLAMSMGKIVISPPTPYNKDIIQNGVNGYIAESLDVIVKIINDKIFTNNPSVFLAIGTNAQKTIEQKFNLKKFIDLWNNLITQTSNKVFRM